MVTIESQAERRDGVTLVTATITVESGSTKVTVESRLDGPVWPPRRQGEPTAGWLCGSDGRERITSYEGVVPEEGPLAIGFASPAVPSEPPAEITNVEPVEDDSDEMTTPTAVLRGLGDPSPPSLIEADESPAADVAEEDPVRPTIADSEAPTTADGAEPEPEGHSPSGKPPDPEPNAELPPDLAAWLDATERRIECAEGLEATASIEAATEALRECGGVEGARTLDGQLATDAEHLQTLATRASELAERAESTAAAIEALERLT